MEEEYIFEWKGNNNTFRLNSDGYWTGTIEIAGEKEAFIFNKTISWDYFKDFMKIIDSSFTSIINRSKPIISALLHSFFGGDKIQKLEYYLSHIYLKGPIESLFILESIAFSIHF